MKRVAWPAFNSSCWVGGLNYFCNLSKALQCIPNPQVEIVLLGDGSTLPAPLHYYTSLPLPALRKYSPRWWLGKLEKRILGSDSMLASFLADNGIDIFSHGSVLGRTSTVPSLCWIADFQERYLPHFFSAKELRGRAYSQKTIADCAQGVLLSSCDAHADFCRLFPNAAHKAHVLNFVAHVQAPANLPPAEAVLQKYAIAEPYFHVPNQLWAHKNHKVIINALTIAKAKGMCPLVVSTGQTFDYRNHRYFADLQALVAQHGLTGRFIFLGMVPFEHVTVLMRNSVALINPSKFEGWSTTVEEAKSLGKRILLSDLAVHKEQAPPRGSYFAADDGEILAVLMLSALHDHDPADENGYMDDAASALPQRMLEYGQAYENLILNTIAPTA